MDQFYLRNVARYHALVNAFKPVPGPVPAATETSPDMVVSARIRPLQGEDIAAGFPSAVFPRPAQTGVLDVHDLYNHPRGRPVLKSFNYQVDKLFDSQTTTEEIYDHLLADLVPYAWNGGIGTLFAYGQTGSGKTFTVSGLERLVLNSLMSGSHEGERQVHLSIIELAGNSAHDLLRSRNPVAILEDSFGTTQLSGASEHLVRAGDTARGLIERAASLRRTAATRKNDASSRSHGICRIRIGGQAAGKTDGFLYLVDLAGSEAARDVAVHGADRMRETREINMSLSVLKDCIRGRAESDAIARAAPGGPRSRQQQLKLKQRMPRVPFRQSALTKVLKHVFDPAGGRACKTVVVACINPSLADVGPSKNTLRYAEMLRVLVPAAKKTGPDGMGPTAWTNAQLRDWIGRNSGSPSISPAILAPTESGAQLLSLSAAEFEDRCLKTAGVSSEQARAFRSKLWQMHIDSQRADTAGTPASSRGDSAGPVPIESHLGGSTSRDSDPAAAAVPFKERIRPGMVIGWSEPAGRSSVALGMPDGTTKMAVVLCPVDAAGGAVKEVSDSAVSPSETSNGDAHLNGAAGYARYLCALVTPGSMADAYEVALWRQVVIDVSMMEREVVLEYDAASRYYYVSV